MKMPDHTITYLQRCGYLTLQIPQFTLHIGEHKQEKTEDYPDDWFMIVHPSGRIATGKEGGFLFYSKKGYETNKPAIKAAFEGSSNKRGTWEEFEIAAGKFFEDTQKKTDKYRITLEKKIEELRIAHV